MQHIERAHRKNPSSILVNIFDATQDNTCLRIACEWNLAPIIKNRVRGRQFC
jgi:hypothetical protein